jgi:two-component system OmpR family response regulator
MLENLLYGQETAPGSNAIEVHLSSLRRKLGAGLIHSERGLGWRLEDKREN